MRLTSMVTVFPAVCPFSFRFSRKAPTYVGVLFNQQKISSIAHTTHSFPLPASMITSINCMRPLFFLSCSHIRSDVIFGQPRSQMNPPESFCELCHKIIHWDTAAWNNAICSILDNTPTESTKNSILCVIPLVLSAIS